MRYVTMDETWIHHYTPESDQQSAEWTANGENHPKQLKTRMLQEKRFGFNEEVITETEAYFKARDKSFYEKVIEMSVKRWNE